MNKVLDKAWFLLYNVRCTIMEIVPIFLCCYSWSIFVPYGDINMGYEEKKANNKTRGESANGKEQNPSGTLRQDAPDELFQTKRSFRDAELN